MANTLKQIAAAPRGAFRLLSSGADRLREVLDLGRRTFKTAEEAVKGTAIVAKQTATLYKDVQAVRVELRALRAELRERLSNTTCSLDGCRVARLPMRTIRGCRAAPFRSRSRTTSNWRGRRLAASKRPIPKAANG
jgi:hypothetical protein